MRTLRFDLADQRLARAAWSRLAEPTDLDAQQLVAGRGPGAALEYVFRGEGAPRWQVRLESLDPAADIELGERDGTRLVIPGDPEWPVGLDRLGVARPFCLWIRGPLDLGTTSERAIAIVGARAATTYGARIAQDLAEGCAGHGIAVVSGAAVGIDGAAHRGALRRDGPTVAVLACGPERVYPRSHDRLLAQIAATGCVVAEVPPGTMPSRWRFLERNRLIAALAQAVVVVEAGHRSGSLGTASRAAQLNITVAAVPGLVTSPASYGAHRLLREGAICVTSADEVVELISPIGGFTAEPGAVPAAAYDGMSTRDVQVYDALPIRAGAEVASISRVAGLDLPSVRAALGRLDLRGLAERHGPGWRRTPVSGRRPPDRAPAPAPAQRPGLARPEGR